MKNLRSSAKSAGDKLVFGLRFLTQSLLSLKSCTEKYEDMNLEICENLRNLRENRHKTARAKKQDGLVYGFWLGGNLKSKIIHLK